MENINYKNNKDLKAINRFLIDLLDNEDLNYLISFKKFKNRKMSGHVRYDFITLWQLYDEIKNEYFYTFDCSKEWLYNIIFENIDNIIIDWAINVLNTKNKLILEYIEYQNLKNKFINHMIYTRYN